MEDLLGLARLPSMVLVWPTLGVGGGLRMTGAVRSRLPSPLHHRAGGAWSL